MKIDGEHESEIDRLKMAHRDHKVALKKQWDELEQKRNVQQQATDLAKKALAREIRECEDAKKLKKEVKERLN